MKKIGSGRVIERYNIIFSILTHIFSLKYNLNSGPNDNVFVYFSDHGAPGIIAFPDGKSVL